MTENQKKKFTHLIHTKSTIFPILKRCCLSKYGNMYVLENILHY